MYKLKLLSTDDLEKQAYALKLHTKVKGKVWGALGIFINTFAEKQEKRHWFEVLHTWYHTENCGENMII